MFSRARHLLGMELAFLERRALSTRKLDETTVNIKCDGIWPDALDGSASSEW
jgi:hypothetical protein